MMIWAVPYVGFSMSRGRERNNDRMMLIKRQGEQKPDASGRAPIKYADEQ
jgi:hypothetical protein